MSVLTLAGSKGGCGKSTVVRMLAALLAREEADFAIIDADPNRAVHRWLSSIYEGPEIVHQAEDNEDRLAHLIAELRQKHALVMVDTAGFENLGSSVAIASADAVLIPCMSSEADLYEARTTAAKVRSLAVTTRREIPAYVVMNGVRATTVSAYAASQVAEAGLSSLKTTLGRRADFEAMTLSGKAPHTGEAWRESTKLLRELRKADAIPAARDRVRT
jgi:chromosome partitioning protein